MNSLVGTTDCPLMRSRRYLGGGPGGYDWQPTIPHQFARLPPSRRTTFPKSLGLHSLTGTTTFREVTVASLAVR